MSLNFPNKGVGTDHQCFHLFFPKTETCNSRYERFFESTFSSHSVHRKLQTGIKLRFTSLMLSSAAVIGLVGLCLHDGWLEMFKSSQNAVILMHKKQLISSPISQFDGPEHTVHSQIKSGSQIAFYIAKGCCHQFDVIIIVRIEKY